MSTFRRVLPFAPLVLVLVSCAERPVGERTEEPAPDEDASAEDLDTPEAREVGPDDARAIEPGPAELEVGMPQGLPNE